MLLSEAYVTRRKCTVGGSSPPLQGVSVDHDSQDPHYLSVRLPSMLTARQSRAQESSPARQIKQRGSADTLVL